MKIALSMVPFNWIKDCTFVLFVWYGTMVQERNLFICRDSFGYGVHQPRYKDTCDLIAGKFWISSAIFVYKFGLMILACMYIHEQTSHHAHRFSLLSWAKYIIYSYTINATYLLYFNYSSCCVLAFHLYSIVIYFSKRVFFSIFLSIIPIFTSFLIFWEP